MQDALKEVERRVTALELANDQLKASLDENTRVTTSIKEDTAGLVEFTKAAQGMVTFGRWVGKALAWLAPIAAAAVAFWAVLKGKQP